MTFMERIVVFGKRDDEFSLREHRRRFDAHRGPKVEYSSNEEAARRAQGALS